MSDTLIKFIEEYKSKLLQEKVKLGIDSTITENNLQNNKSIIESDFDDRKVNNQSIESCPNLIHTENINRSSGDYKEKKLVNLIRDKQNFLQTECSEGNTYDADAVPERHMLRYGEFSPNNPELRGTTQPYLGIGEYEFRKEKLLRERHADFQEFLSKQSKLPNKVTKTKSRRSFHFDEGIRLKDNDTVKNNLLLENKPVYSNTAISKYVQTELQGIQMPIVQYALKSQCPAERDLSSHQLEHDSVIDNAENLDEMYERSRANQLAVKIDRVEIGTQNNIIVPGQDSVPSVNYPVSQSSPREKLMADLKHTYYPSFYNSQKESTDDELVRVNRQKWNQAKKREQYHEELRLQIEQKQRQAEEEAERERREERAMTQRLERQLRQLQLERECEDAKRLARIERLRQNEEEYVRHQKEFQKNIPEIQSTSRRYQSNAVNIKSNTRSEPVRYSEKSFQPSPPLLSQNPPYSFNISQNSVFASSLPVKNYNADFLTKNSHRSNNPVQTRDSNFTHKKISKRLENTKRKQLEDSLPIPVLRVKSPIAQSLKHSSVVDSTATSISDALKTLEGKWEVPAVQRNIFKGVEPQSSNRNKNVLTQLGAIRMQLQQEQLRLDQAIQQNSNKTIAH